MKSGDVLARYWHGVGARWVNAGNGFYWWNGPVFWNWSCRSRTTKVRSLLSASIYDVLLIIMILKILFTVCMFYFAFVSV